MKLDDKTKLSIELKDSIITADKDAQKLLHILDAEGDSVTAAQLINVRDALHNALDMLEYGC
jgi:hypothetical protein